eukprot:1629861-Amphidinium_carterae.1
MTCSLVQKIGALEHVGSLHVQMMTSRTRLAFHSGGRSFTSSAACQSRAGIGKRQREREPLRRADGLEAQTCDLTASCLLCGPAGRRHC